MRGGRVAAIGFCPFCGAPLAGTAGVPAACPSCGRAFAVAERGAGAEAE